MAGKITQQGGTYTWPPAGGYDPLDLDQTPTIDTGKEASSADFDLKSAGRDTDNRGVDKHARNPLHAPRIT